MNNKLCISVVSHGHGLMVQELVIQLLKLDVITELIVTLNIPEKFPIIADKRLKLVHNRNPKGFGENHNDAFAVSNCDYFCVLNPDIVFTENPFPKLFSRFNQKSVGLVAPLVFSNTGTLEDSMRRFLTPRSFIRRLIGQNSCCYELSLSEGYFYPDWVAGMFMLFNSEAYSAVGGFDEKYFMYCEDMDICTRLWKVGYSVVGCTSVSVIHNAQRASHRSFKHLSWHIRSLITYFSRYAFSLPRK